VIVEGQIVLFRFPQTDLANAKLRPALVVRRLPGKFDDWLICMMSSQLAQEIPAFDEVISTGDADFPASGLKVATLIRIARLASVERALLRGKIGHVSPERLERVKIKLGQWLIGQ
jgi:mRNA interferase MazF